MKWTYILCFLLGLYIPMAAQQFLNGSFEGSDLDCGIDLTNAEFTAFMPQVVGFGEKDELDILTASCGFGNAQNGTHFVGLRAVAGITDAIGLELSESLLPGQTYTIAFYARLAFSTNTPVRLSIGVVNNPTAHGELVFSVFDLIPEWKRFDFQFSSPSNISYITAIIETAGEAIVHLDNFSIVCPPLYLGKDTTYCTVQEVTLSAPSNYETYLWSNQSTSASITINTPGLYWVEASVGNCSVRDSINIFEDAFNCRCQLYFPDAFSPNDDGINDTWQPLGPCEVSEYQLHIYNRWGGQVFQSTTLTEGWTGKMNNRRLPAGQYAYLLTYRSAQSPDVLQQSEGRILLVR